MKIGVAVSENSATDEHERCVLPEARSQEVRKWHFSEVPPAAPDGR
jgi:hypothetical protein